MSTDVTPDPQSPSPDPGPSGPPLDVRWLQGPPRRKFQHPYGRHLLFFILTFLSTTLTTGWLAIWVGVNPLPLITAETFMAGLWFSVPLLTILSAHEFGHYLACRYHNVDATLPYFLPAPLPFSGTLGAVIRIKEPFPTTKALFDIGVAGPIAGFVALVPFLYWGMSMSELMPMPTDGVTPYFGEPLLWKLVEWQYFGAVATGYDVALHPLGFAAWWGTLATALNLLPFGQLDGGHIMYANLGRRASLLSAATLAAVVLLTFQSASWFLTAVLMAAMALLFGFRHPRVLDQHEPLSRGRRTVSLIALLIFVMCFTPVPISVNP